MKLSLFPAHNTLCAKENIVRLPACRRAIKVCKSTARKEPLWCILILLPHWLERTSESFWLFIYFGIDGSTIFVEPTTIHPYVDCNDSCITWVILAEETRFAACASWSTVIKLLWHVLATIWTARAHDLIQWANSCNAITELRVDTLFNWTTVTKPIYCAVIM